MFNNALRIGQDAHENGLPYPKIGDLSKQSSAMVRRNIKHVATRARANTTTQASTRIPARLGPAPQDRHQRAPLRARDRALRRRRPRTDRPWTGRRPPARDLRGHPGYSDRDESDQPGTARRSPRRTSPPTAGHCSPSSPTTSTA
ncbi:hypothetical protein [Streptomyces chartreusis]|uniref:hypothetical protein n=1 Tax=Streptomyces chartreusis TaxID=1969 RepID=UPI003626771D